MYKAPCAQKHGTMARKLHRASELDLTQTKQLFPRLLLCTHIHLFNRNSGAQVAHRCPCPFLCLCSRYHVRATHEWLFSCKIRCPRRQGSGPAVRSYWSCRESLSRGTMWVHGCSLERLQSTMQPNRHAHGEMSQEEKGLPVDVVGNNLHLMIFSAYVVAAQNDFC